MRVKKRPSLERGYQDYGWLQTYHSFSFGDYYDPAHMQFHSLRVCNEDTVAGGAGFPPHSHAEMEIVTIVIEGTLAHTDSSGGEGTITAGQVQVMSAGTGVTHSEYNGSKTVPVHFFQLWFLPRQVSNTPRYAEATYDIEQLPHDWIQLVGALGTTSRVKIDTDVRLFRRVISASQSVRYTLEKQRAVYLQVIAGEVQLLGQHLLTGDALCLEGEGQLELLADKQTDLLLIDLAA